MRYILGIMVWEGIDERRFPRVKYKCLITVLGDEQKKPISAFTENIGTGGLCVIIKKSFRIFDSISLDIDLDDGMGPVLCKGTVVWVVKSHRMSKSGKDTYDVGIEFLGLLEEDKQRIANIVKRLFMVKT